MRTRSPRGTLALLALPLVAAVALVGCTGAEQTKVEACARVGTVATSAVGTVPTIVAKIQTNPASAVGDLGDLQKTVRRASAKVTNIEISGLLAAVQKDVTATRKSVKAVAAQPTSADTEAVKQSLVDLRTSGQQLLGACTG